MAATFSPPSKAQIQHEAADYAVEWASRSVLTCTGLLSQRLRDAADRLDAEVAKEAVRLGAGGNDEAQLIQQMTWALQHAVQVDVAWLAVDAMDKVRQLGNAYQARAALPKADTTQ